MATTCKECAEFVGLEPGTAREGIWYNHLCKANPFPVGIDPYDGELKPMSQNDLGQTVFVEHRWDYCRNHNDGRCKRYHLLERSKDE